MSEEYPAERSSIAAAAPKRAAAPIGFGQTPDLDPTIHEPAVTRALPRNQTPVVAAVGADR